MKIMPENDSYASGEDPEDFCIRVRTPFSHWDTEFSFFASRDSGHRPKAALRLLAAVPQLSPSHSAALQLQQLSAVIQLFAVLPACNGPPELRVSCVLVSTNPASLI